MPRTTRGRKKRRNRGWFKKGFDPRRHIFTHEERVRGGKSCWRKMLVLGGWRLDWLDRCLKRKVVDYDRERDRYPDEVAEAQDLPL